MLLGLPDLFSFVQSAGKPFLCLPATTFVESIGLWDRECAVANTDLTPSWRQVHGAVMRMVIGRTLPTTPRRPETSRQIFDQLDSEMILYESFCELTLRYCKNKHKFGGHCIVLLNEEILMQRVALTRMMGLPFSYPDLEKLPNSQIISG